MHRGEDLQSRQQDTTVVNIYEAGPFEGRLEQWPVLAVSGALEVRLAETELEVEQAQRLRYSVFYEEMSAVPSPAMRDLRRDFDKYDEVCDHLLVVDRDAHDEDGQPLVVGTYRLTREQDAARAGGFYTASEYDLLPMISGLPQAEPPAQAKVFFLAPLFLYSSDPGKSLSGHPLQLRETAHPTDRMRM